MRLEITETNTENIVKLALRKSGKDIMVTDGDFDLVGFRVVDNKVHLVRYKYVENPNLALDSHQRIVEVPE